MISFTGVKILHIQAKHLNENLKNYSNNATKPDFYIKPQAFIECKKKKTYVSLLLTGDEKEKVMQYEDDLRRTKTHFAMRRTLAAYEYYRDKLKKQAGEALKIEELKDLCKIDFLPPLNLSHIGLFKHPV